MLKVTSFTFLKHKKEDECQNTNGKRSFNRRCVDAIRTQLLDCTGVKKKPSLFNSKFSRFSEFTRYRNVNTFNDFEKKK